MNVCALLTTLTILSAHKSGAVDVDQLDQNQIFDAIIANTNYDTRRRPFPDGPNKPVGVQTSLYMYFLGHIDDERLEFETILMVRHRWTDPRLRFRNANVSEEAMSDIHFLEGEDWFVDRIWTPNVFIENEQSSSITGLLRDNEFVRIEKNGEVQFNYRVSAKVFCNMDLERFPHDKQFCSLRLESWSLQSSDMILTWSPLNPLQINEFIMPEYSLVNSSTTGKESCYNDNFPSPRMRGSTKSNCEAINMFEGRNFSTIYVNLALKRQIGHYLLNYYIPSILLVCMSWVSFWLHPNAVPGRTTLGTSTWLTFITLTHNTGTNSLPNVSYIKYLDIWFLACTLFIISSLLEFAFVNSVSRRTETVTVRNLSAKSILPAAASVFATPAVRRKHSTTASPESTKKKKARKLSTGKEDSNSLSPRLSVSSADSVMSNDNGNGRQHLSVHHNISIPHISLPDGTELSFDNPIDAKSPISNDIEMQKEKTGKFGINFEDMTSEEIALWVDMKARTVFPILFILFNIGYWFFAGRADCAIFYTCDAYKNENYEL